MAGGGGVDVFDAAFGIHGENGKVVDVVEKRGKPDLGLLEPAFTGGFSRDIGDRNRQTAVVELDQRTGEDLGGEVARGSRICMARGFIMQISPSAPTSRRPMGQAYRKRKRFACSSATSPSVRSAI